MKVVVALFRFIMIPLAIVFAYLAGLLMAVVSGLIEYHVLQQWLHIDGQGLTFLPIIIVVGLEGYKLFMHFSKAAFNQNSISDENLEDFRRFMPFLKWGLIAFSFICTVIFTANVFYFKVPESRSAEQKAAHEAVEAEYQKQFEAEAREIDRSYNETLAAAHEPVVAAKEYFDSIKIIYTPLRDYIRTSEQKENARIALEAAQTSYKEAQKAADEERQTALEALRKKLNPWREEQLMELNKEALAMTSVAGDNAYLRSFLLFFSETFSKREYTRGAYFGWVIGISLALSALSEGVITASQYVVNLPVSTLQAIAGDYKFPEDEKRKLTRLVGAITSVFVAMSVFLIYGAFQEVTYNRVELGAAMTCSLLAMLLPSAVTSFGHIANESKAEEIAKNLLGDVRALAVKTLLSFSFFVLIGMFFGETFSALSVPAIGIAVGNAAGHLLHLLPATPQPQSV